MTEVKLWLAFSMIGVLVAIIAFCMIQVEDMLIEVKGEVFQYLTTQAESISAISFFISISIVFAATAAMLTVYVAPNAAGSGIPELIGCLNGVRISEYLTPTVLLVKATAVVFAIAGTLVVGKEGPLAHVGAAAAILILFAPIQTGFDEFRTNQRYREFVAAGISAGVSVAFGAPMGGALFAYELSGPSTFWTFKLIWRNFFCASISTFSLAIFFAFKSGAALTLSSQAVLKFGTINTLAAQPLVPSIIAALLLGLAGGLLGVVFSWTVRQTKKLRTKHVDQNWKKVVQVATFACLTAGSFFILVKTFNRCATVPSQSVSFTPYQSKECRAGQYSPMATLLFNSQGGQIRVLLSNSVQLNLTETVAFMAVYFFFTVTSYGLSVPAGLFLPAIILGCALGQLYQDVTVWLSPQFVIGDSFMIVGAAAVLAGYTRQTYSIAVIMLETTQSINLFLPILIAILVSTWVGNLFNKSVYQVAIELNQIPVLSDSISFQNQFTRVSEIMSSDVKSLPVLVSVASIQKALDTKHTSFPVTTANNVLVGTISARFIKLIIVNERWTENVSKSQKIASMQQMFLSPQGDLVSSRTINEWESCSDDSIKVQSAHSYNSVVSFEQLQLKRIKTLQESIPPSTLEWQQLVLTEDETNEDFEKVCLLNAHKMVDLSQYMVEAPIAVQPLDRVGKAFNLFRLLQLKILPVVEGNQIVGVITRQNLAALVHQ